MSEESRTPYELCVDVVSSYGKAMSNVVWKLGSLCRMAVEGAYTVEFWKTQEFVGDGKTAYRSVSGLVPDLALESSVSESTLSSYFSLGRLLVQRLGMKEKDVRLLASKIHHGGHEKHLRRLDKDNCSTEVQEYIEILRTHGGRDVVDKDTVDALLVSAGLKDKTGPTTPTPVLSSVPDIAKDDIPAEVIRKAVAVGAITTLSSVVAHYESLLDDDKRRFFSSVVPPPKRPAVKPPKKANGVTQLTATGIVEVK